MKIFAIDLFFYIKKFSEFNPIVQGTIFNPIARGVRRGGGRGEASPPAAKSYKILRYENFSVCILVFEY